MQTGNACLKKPPMPSKKALHEWKSDRFLHEIGSKYFLRKSMHNTITHLSLLKLLFCFLLAFGISRNLAAEPGKGPALGLGSGSLKPINANNDTEYHSSSVYGGSFDYQWPLSSWLSTSLMVHESGGEGSMPTKSEYKYYKSGIIGLQLKIWMGPLYLGVHGGQYYHLDRIHECLFRHSAGRRERLQHRLRNQLGMVPCGFFRSK